MKPEKDDYFFKQIAIIFIRLEFNFRSKCENSTSIPLPIDCLNFSSKQKIFNIVVKQLEYQTLQILDQSVISFSSKLTLSMLKTIVSNSIFEFLELDTSTHFNKSLAENFTNYFSMCDLLLWHYIIEYFIFGDLRRLCSQKSIKISKFLIEEQLLVILTSFVIKISNLVVYHILNYDSDLYIEKILKSLYLKQYLSARSLTNLKNNLLIFNFLDFYVYSPKSVYENKYLVWTIISGSVSSKYIYCDRKKELEFLCKPQIFIVFLLELQDLLFPKFQSFVYLVGKSLVYLTSYFVSTLLGILLNNFPD
nr:Ycf55 [Madagascaria erythrocladioides]